VEEEVVTDPVQPRPVPGPVRPRPGPVGPLPSPPSAVGPATSAGDDAAAPVAEGSPFAGLPGRPVAEHVAVFEAEHERLQRELSTIDQL
jgi:hypothetical protein